MAIRYINNPIKLFLERLLAFLSIILIFPLLLFLFALCSLSTKSFGIYIQHRIGRYGRRFKCLKFKTMMDQKNSKQSSIANLNFSRITKFGLLIRKYKLDELPQLFNICIGQMSFIGPRPDVPGYANNLKGEFKKLLLINPGITSSASIFFSNEEELFKEQENMEKYNKNYIWPLKVFLNKHYLLEASFLYDIIIILATLGIFRNTFENYLKIKVSSFILKVNIINKFMFY